MESTRRDHLLTLLFLLLTLALFFVNITQRESRLSPKREPRFSRNRAAYIQK
ncbi:MAG: hypothetical protein GX635_06250 [Synergistaceae bacterium]|nr:hypothetical protein [Synergistaceae bacterium]